MYDERPQYVDEKPATPLASVETLQALQIWAARAHTLAITAILAAGFDAIIFLYYLFQSQRLVTRQYILQEEGQRYTITEPVLQPLSADTLAVAALALIAFTFLVLAAATATTLPRSVRVISEIALLQSAERTHWFAFALLIFGLFSLVIMLFIIAVAERNFLQMNSFPV